MVGGLAGSNAPARRRGGGYATLRKAVFAGKAHEVAQKTALKATNLRKGAQGDEGVRNREKKSR